MLSLTKQERLVLSILAAVIISGLILNYCFKKYPQFQSMVSFIDSDQLKPKKKGNSKIFMKKK